MFLNMSYVIIKNVTELLIFFNKITPFFFLLQLDY